jgi:hypothetical protein
MNRPTPIPSLVVALLIGALLGASLYMAFHRRPARVSKAECVTNCGDCLIGLCTELPWPPTFEVERLFESDTQLELRWRHIAPVNGQDQEWRHEVFTVNGPTHEAVITDHSTAPPVGFEWAHGVRSPSPRVQHMMQVGRRMAVERLPPDHSKAPPVYRLPSGSLVFSVCDPGTDRCYPRVGQADTEWLWRHHPEAFRNYVPAVAWRQEGKQALEFKNECPPPAGEVSCRNGSGVREFYFHIVDPFREPQTGDIVPTHVTKNGADAVGKSEDSTIITNNIWHETGRVTFTAGRPPIRTSQLLLLPMGGRVLIPLVVVR